MQIYSFFCMNTPRKIGLGMHVHIFKLTITFSPTLKWEGRPDEREFFFSCLLCPAAMGQNWAVFPTHFAHISRGARSPPLLACHAMQETLWPANLVHALFNDKGRDQRELRSKPTYNYAFTFWEKKWKKSESKGRRSSLFVNSSVENSLGSLFAQN